MAFNEEHHHNIFLDKEHIWHPYTQAKLAGVPFLVQSAKDEFIYVLDENGNEKKLIDGISSWWVNIHGHSNKYINDRIKEQLDKHEQVIFAGFTHEPAIKLVEKLCQILPKADITQTSHGQRVLKKAFFSDNGSTSVEVAIKMAIQYFYNQGHEGKNRIMALKGSYHGDTVGTMAVGDTPVFHQAFKSILYPVDFVDPPIPELVKANVKLDEGQKNKLISELYQEKEDEIIEHIFKQFKRYRGEGVDTEYAAFIVEPLIQGAGGMKFYRPQFLQKLRKVCSDFDVLLIADEVFTGFGRTGDDFACKKATIVPDIICLSKALTAGYLPMGMTVTTDEVYSAFYSDSRMKTFFHGHSYTGNSLSAVAALASLELYIEEKRLEDVQFLNMMMNRLLNTKDLLSKEIVKDIRVMGAVAVIEFATNLNDAGQNDYLSNLGPALTKYFIDRGILLRPLGNVLYFMPPYTIKVESLEYCLKTIKEAVEFFNEQSSYESFAKAKPEAIDFT